MQLILSTLGQAFRKRILTLGLMIFISLSSLFVFIVQPSYAITSVTDKLTPQEKINRAYEYSEATGLNEEERQEEYEKAVKEAKSPELQEKEYEESEKAYNQANQPGLVEKAQELVDKVTSKK